MDGRIHYHPTRWARSADGRLTGWTRKGAAVFASAVSADSAGRDAFGADHADPMPCDCERGRTALGG